MNQKDPGNWDKQIIIAFTTNIQIIFMGSMSTNWWSPEMKASGPI